MCHSVYLRSNESAKNDNKQIVHQNVYGSTTFSTRKTVTCITSGVCHVNVVAGSAPFNCFLASSVHSGWRPLCEHRTVNNKRTC